MYSIYQLECQPANLFIIGYTSKSVEEFLDDKIFFAKQGGGNSNPNIDSAIRKYGADSLQITALEEGIPSKRLAMERKTHYMDTVHPVPWYIKIR